MQESISPLHFPPSLTAPAAPATGRTASPTEQHAAGPSQDRCSRRPWPAHGPLRKQMHLKGNPYGRQCLPQGKGMPGIVAVGLPDEEGRCLPGNVDLRGKIDLFLLAGYKGAGGFLPEGGLQTDPQAVHRWRRQHSPARRHQGRQLIRSTGSAAFASPKSKWVAQLLPSIPPAENPITAMRSVIPSSFFFGNAAAGRPAAYRPAHHSGCMASSDR